MLVNGLAVEFFRKEDDEMAGMLAGLKKQIPEIDFALCRKVMDKARLTEADLCIDCRIVLAGIIE